MTSEDNMTWEENLRENLEYSHLMEMVVLRKHETGLPVNIWINQKKNFNDEKCIKFQFDNGDNPNSNYMIPMTIDDNPEIKIKNLDKIKLSKNELDLIKKFIILNLDILLKLGDGSGLKEFFEKMKKVE